MLPLTYLCKCPFCLDVDAIILLKAEYNVMLSLTYLCNCPVCLDVDVLILFTTQYTCLDAVLTKQKQMHFVVSYLKLT